MATIAIPAARLEHADDCFAAAVRLVERKIPACASWDLSPRWDDEDERTAVLVDIPDVEIEDVAEAMAIEAGAHGDREMVAICDLARLGDLDHLDLDEVTTRALERDGIDPSKLDAADLARAALARQIVLG